MVELEDDEETAEVELVADDSETDEVELVVEDESVVEP